MHIYIYICVSKLTIIGSDNGLLPGRCQAIIWTNPGLLLKRTLGTNFSEILREILTFSFKKMQLKISSGKCQPFCLSLNVLTHKKYSYTIINESASFVYIKDLNLVITVPADDLAPNGARSSAGIVMIIKSDMVFFVLFFLILSCYQWFLIIHMAQITLFKKPTRT